jgi:flagellar biogenesis protein FliO
MNTAPQVEPLQPMSGEPLLSLPAVGHWSHALLLRTSSALKWIMQRVRAQQARRNLRVCENVSLGDKRFVAVVQVDEERFLIGGSSSSVSLLARLPEAKAFAADLERAAGKIS